MGRRGFPVAWGLICPARLRVLERRGCSLPCRAVVRRPKRCSVGIKGCELQGVRLCLNGVEAGEGGSWVGLLKDPEAGGMWGFS